jgi:hypothetical protein
MASLDCSPIALLAAHLSHDHEDISSLAGHGHNLIVQAKLLQGHQAAGATAAARAAWMVTCNPAKPDV